MATGLAKGKDKGHKVTKIAKVNRSRKGSQHKRVHAVRELVREVVGLSPYERRILDMIHTGGASADKRIYKFAKRRLGSHKRAIQKREDIKAVNAAQR
eukprot:CAMPEP_0118646048 /NCGR_PEP_ID=MMETSP0785-20121206/7835_1 /TAXON_ID=91992 /ORGANISM="Bolidomonas pacifica, Strain CCMP 1866" /LENGTH=97 /DNA_ID=CAMNT_0006537989 /DNA_START=8 /DNA_END=297 /DNA_ORIENTATION=+